MSRTGRSLKPRWCIVCWKRHAPSKKPDGCPAVPHQLVAVVPPEVTLEFRRWCVANDLSQGEAVTVALLKLLRSGQGVPKYAERYLGKAREVYQPQSPPRNPLIPGADARD